MPIHVSDESLKSCVEAIRTSESLAQAARKTKLARSTFANRVRLAVNKGFISQKEVDALAASGKVKMLKVYQETVDAFQRYNLNYNATAEFLGIPDATLKTRLREARKMKIKPSNETEGNGEEAEEEEEEWVTSDAYARVEREKTLLKDEVRRLRAKVKQQHRDEGLYEALCEEIEKRVEPINPLPPAIIKPSPTEVHHESLVMHMSDEHTDAVVPARRVGGMEEYNFEVALARAERYVEKVINVSQNTMSNYRFDELWILAYGDHISGEIHDHTRYGQYRNVLDAAIACGQMHALMIRDLAPYFPVVRVVYLPGNHGRRSKKKNYKGPDENWDYLIGRVSQMLCMDIPNVDFLIPDSFSVTLEINGWNFCAFHGDDIRSWNSIPHYGIERKTRRLTSLHAAQGRQIHYFVMGHFHSRGSMEHPSGEVLLNGAWCATDEYAYEALGAIHRPSQLLHGVGASYGVSFRFPIYLKFDGDTEGPKRYKAPLRTTQELRDTFTGSSESE